MNDQAEIKSEESYSFHNKIENLTQSNDIKYLLNFWYTTKVNKENSFIKRNGLHPKLRVTSSNSHNGITVDKSDLKTNFYTVFRIYIENLFPNAKVAKQRDIEIWNISYESSEINILDIPMFLLMYYSQKTNIPREHLLIGTNQRRPWEKADLTKINLHIGNNKDFLYTKKITDELVQIQEKANENIDNDLLIKMDMLLQKISNEFSVSKISDESSIGRLDDNIKYGISSHELKLINDLLPIHEMLKNQVTFSNYQMFSFVLNYAKISNPIFNDLHETDQHYNAFKEIVLQQAA